MKIKKTTHPILEKNRKSNQKQRQKDQKTKGQGEQKRIMKRNNTNTDHH